MGPAKDIILNRVQQKPSAEKEAENMVPSKILEFKSGLP